MTGTTIAQAIPIAISPILTRIYTPEDFGALALYLGIASLISVISTGKYELAIILPRREKLAINVMMLTIILSFIISIITFILIFLFSSIIIDFFGASIANKLYFIPITVFLTGIYQSFIFWMNRNKQYKSLSKNKIFQSSITATSNLGMGLNGFGINGLIFSGILGQFSAILLLFKGIWRKDHHKIRYVSKNKIKYAFIKYRNFLFYSMPMGFLNTLSFNIMNYVLPLLFNTLTLGFYYLSQRILNTPLEVISSSFSSVFYQELTQSSNKLKLLLKSYLINLLIGLIITLPFMLYGEIIFAFIFGSKWIKAGEIAGVIAPLLIFSFATGSISQVFSYLQKNEILLYWQIFYILILFGLIFYFKSNFYTLLYSITIFGSCMYIILFLFAYLVLKNAKDSSLA